jgi:hypothetical protein
MELKNLNCYLSSKFSFKNSSTLKCTLCNNFIGTNLKSLAVHKRKCKGVKTTEISNTSEEKSDEYNNIILINEDNIKQESKETSSEDKKTKKSKNKKHK